MKNNMKSKVNLSIIGSVLLVVFALALSACNAIADTSNLNQTKTMWIKLTPSAPVFDDGVGTATLELDFDRDIPGLTDDLKADALGKIFTFVYNGSTSSGISATEVKKLVVGLYSLTVTNVPNDEGGIVQVSIATPGVAPPTRYWALNGAPLYTRFIYNETADPPPMATSMHSDNKAPSVADGKMAAMPSDPDPEPESAYDPSKDEIVNMGKLADWTMDSMTADARLAMLCMERSSVTINGKVYQTQYIHEIIWGSDVEDATTIGDNFLSGFHGLALLDLSPLPKLTSIGDNFLSYCTSLELLDLTPLSKLTRIGDNFLYNCTSLVELDLSPLSNLAGIGEGFLSYCTSLESLNLSKLSNVSSVGNDFLRYCSSLKALDLSSLSNLISIGDYFLLGCNGLAELDLSRLSKLTSIGDYFLGECVNVEALDLPPLSNSTSIGAWFLYDCENLVSLDLTPLSELTSINGCFLSFCSRLESLDLSPLSHLSGIGESFLSYCNGLTSVNMGEISCQTLSPGNSFLIIGGNPQVKVVGNTDDWANNFEIARNNGVRFVNQWE